MNKIIILAVLMLSSIFSGCESDDICDANTATTPRLVISFYDINDPTTLKSVTNLKIIAEGMTEGITYSSSTLINGSKVAIPLKTEADQVRYRFILNYDNSNTAIINEDIIQFDYTRTTLFVSRACGYKTNYILNTDKPITQSDATPADGLWMINKSVKNRTIDNENETHLEVYF